MSTRGRSNSGDKKGFQSPHPNTRMSTSTSTNSGKNLVVNRNTRMNSQDKKNSTGEDGNMSPTAWIFERGSQVIKPCFDMFGEDDSKPNKPTHAASRNVTSRDDHRERYHSQTTGEDADDEEDEILAKLAMKREANKKRRNTIVTSGEENSPVSTLTHSTNKTTQNEHAKPRSQSKQGEPRIIAPNVGKLSPYSVVEVKLKSSNECVVVQCAVDVLKM